MTDKEKYKKLDDLNFDAFRNFASDDSLTKYEKIGFPDSYREGVEQLIFDDIVRKLELDNGDGKIIMDIGGGSVDVASLS